MPRAKPSAPRRLDEGQREEQEWRMGQDAAPSPPDVQDWRAEIVNADSDDSSDASYAPPDDVQDVRDVPKVRQSRPKPKDELEALDEALESDLKGFVCDGSKYRLKVRWRKPETGWKSTLGSFTFTFAPDAKDFQVQLSSAGEFYLIVSEAASFAYVLQGTGCRIFHLLPVPNLRLLEAFDQRSANKSRKPVVELEVAELTGHQLVVDAVLREHSLVKLTHPSDSFVKIPAEMRRVLRHFLLDQKTCEDLDFESEESSLLKVKTDDLFRKITRRHAQFIQDSGSSKTEPQHPSLLPNLRPYQRHAVQWMLSKETGGSSVNENDTHVLYQKVKLRDGNELYFNPISGYLVREEPKAVPHPPGGILADEMGLGKTVEILSLMLCNPRQNLPEIEWKEPILSHEKETRKRRRRRSPSPTEWQLQEVIPQIDGGDSDVDSGGPGPSRRRAAKKVRFYETESESDDDCWRPPKKKKKVTAPKRPQKPALKRTMEPDTEPKFDPFSIFGTKVLTPKSKLSDMVLRAIAVVGQESKAEETGVSVNYIKRHIYQNFGKKSCAQTNKAINKEILWCLDNGLVLNTSGIRGASGSFRINPHYKDFDSRRLYMDKTLDNVERTLEEVISRVCYEDRPCVKTEMKATKKVIKKESLYEKLKPMYESHLAEMSEAATARKKQYHGTFFDTKVGPMDYFECVCGEDDVGAAHDRKWRVKCGECRQSQHAACVGYDVANPLRGDYFCPHCWTTLAPAESKATLIVSPAAIAYQWVDEIKRHLSADVKVLFYRGTKAAGYVQPRHLAAYDIVVTTYQVLQSETNYVDLAHNNSLDGRRLRNPKRWMAVPAPLPCVNWWRICLDEAQMIETTTTKTAEMARRLSAVNRWCVTGTPIRDSLLDFHGLLVFLGIDPYNVEAWWKQALCLPYVRGRGDKLEAFLAQFLWRTVKKDVLDQIDVPHQSEIVHQLQFSPVEEHFYRRQHIECAQDVQRKIGRFALKPEQTLSQLDRKSLAQILQPIVKLRQACCHPQIVKGMHLNMQKSTLTMEQLLDNMIKKVTVECEEANRQYIAGLNGLAAIHIMDKEWGDAAEYYRTALRWMDEYKDKVKTDTLQKLHTVHNLAESIETNRESIPPTTRDDQLRDEAHALRQKYLTKYLTAITVARVRKTSSY